MSRTKTALTVYGVLIVALIIWLAIAPSWLAGGLLAFVVVIAGLHVIMLTNRGKGVQERGIAEAEARKARPTGMEHPHY